MDRHIVLTSNAIGGGRLIFPTDNIVIKERDSGCLVYHGNTAFGVTENFEQVTDKLEKLNDNGE